MRGTKSGTAFCRCRREAARSAHVGPAPSELRADPAAPPGCPHRAASRAVLGPQHLYDALQRKQAPESLAAGNAKAQAPAGPPPMPIARSGPGSGALATPRRPGSPCG